MFLIITLALLFKLSPLLDIPPLEPCLCELGLGPRVGGRMSEPGSLQRHTVQSPFLLFLSSVPDSQRPARLHPPFPEVQADG